MIKLYVDARCLQDPNFASRGVGHHSATVLADARSHFPDGLEVSAILDPGLPALAEEHARLFDRSTYAAFPPDDRARALFLQLSPMTHDQDMLAPVLKLAHVYKAAILYDFIPLLERDRYLRDTATRRAYYTALVSLRGYDRYLAISKYTAGEAERIVGVPAAKVDVTGVAVRDAFPRRRSLPGIPRDGERYFFLVGGGDPRKNVECAVQAHAALAHTAAPASSLWVLGRYDDYSKRRLLETYSRGGGRALRFLENVSDDELANLYHGAIANVCPSRAEGFSIPVVEAIAAGCPVLVSSCAAHRELMPLPEAQFDPDDSRRLTSLMEGLLEDSAGRDALLDLQLPFARRFDRAEVTARFWRSVKEGFDAWTPRVRPRRPGLKPRLAFCTPYPPAHSGVADYTARAIREVARHAIVDVLSPQETFIEDPSVRRFRYLTALPYVHDEYDRVISVVGNSSYHVRIVELLCRYGGACISHDNRLSDFYNAWRGPMEFNELARRILRRQVSVSESQGWVWHPERLPSLFLDEVLPRSEPFIVHSRGIQKEIKKQYGRDVAYLPFCVHREVDEGELTSDARREARARLGIASDRLVVITLGIVGATKAPLECVSAVRQVVDSGVLAHLYFVGSADGIGNEVRTRAKRLGVADHIHLVDGWASDERYRDYLRAADFAIQLRTHGFGGLSGAALDCLAYGVPTVMNQDLADAMEAPGYVSVVPDRIDPASIAEAVIAGIRSGVHLERLSESRRSYVAAHSFEEYATGLLRLLELT